MALLCVLLGQIASVSLLLFLACFDGITRHRGYRVATMCLLGADVIVFALLGGWEEWELEGTLLWLGPAILLCIFSLALRKRQVAS
jgi:hypothetical protein